MVYATDFVGNTDNDIIDKAIANKDEDGIVVIGAKKDGGL